MIRVTCWNPGKHKWIFNKSELNYRRFPKTETNPSDLKWVLYGVSHARCGGKLFFNSGNDFPPAKNGFNTFHLLVRVSLHLVCADCFSFLVSSCPDITSSLSSAVFLENFGS